MEPRGRTWVVQGEDRRLHFAFFQVLVLDRLEDCLQAIDGVAALAGAETLHGVVDRHMLGQPRGSLGGSYLEDAAQVKVQTEEDLIAGGELGQSFEKETSN